MLKRSDAARSQLSKHYETEAVKAYTENRITFSDLVASLARSPATARRYVRQFRETGSVSIDKHRGKRGGRRQREDKEHILAIIRDRYHDFGPQLASEKLEEFHGYKVSAETLRKWMTDAGLWKDRAARQPRIFQLREPRPRRGELIQVDGSYHRWLEKRGPELCLLVFIDDATSELMHLRFCQHETSFDYMHALRAYIHHHGVPQAIYSDRHSIFRTTREGNFPRRPTQFARAASKLGIDVICAESPQAKGRVERANRTLQDRLIKEMRLRDISTVNDANLFLEEYRRLHNARFARLPLSQKDAHRPPPKDGLESLLTYQVERKVFKDLHLSFNKMILILDDTPLARQTVGKKVIVSVALDGAMNVVFREENLAYRVFDKLRRVSGVPDTVCPKRLSSALAVAKQIEEAEPHHYKRNAHVLAGFRKFFFGSD